MADLSRLVRMKSVTVQAQQPGHDAAPVQHQNHHQGMVLKGVVANVKALSARIKRGGNLGNAGEIRAEFLPWMGQPYSAEIELPPLAGIMLAPA